MISSPKFQLALLSKNKRRKVLQDFLVGIQTPKVNCRPILGLKGCNFRDENDDIVYMG